MYMGKSRFGCNRILSTASTEDDNGNVTGIHTASIAGTVVSYLKDYHGNIVGRANKSGTTLDDTTDYDAFGNKITEATAIDNFGYCGEYCDGESGLIYLRNRYYDTATGRFITEDPAMDGVNWYVYCGNNPVKNIDSSGLADVPQMGTLELTSIINKSMGIIYNKLEYIEGDRYFSHIYAETNRASIKNEWSSINGFSPALAGIINDVVISGTGTIQEISSVIAICVEMRESIIERRITTGDEIYSEELVYKKYDYYRQSGNIYLAGDNRHSVAEKILPYSGTGGNGDTFVGNSPLLGYWVKVIYYDKYVVGYGDAMDDGNEDWPLEKFN